MTTDQIATRDVLTQEEAESRAARLSNVSYEIDLRLTRGAESYHGEVVARFDLSG